jgi:uncharacterized protein YjdB
MASAVTLPLGKKVALGFNFVDANGVPVPQDATIAWVSSDVTKATVLSSGAQGGLNYAGLTCEVTSVAVGPATITGTGTTPEGVALSTTCVVTVSAAAGPLYAAVAAAISPGLPV